MLLLNLIPHKSHLASTILLLFFGINSIGTDIVS
ncbi:hypothetical protein vBEcoMWL3_gp161c [Escherichia phage vB_EcoM_WL-3]|nr:hypothetical protein vBEcoMWL3_gp161c [Escherichia phage vB_EcoM_WL-3]